MCGNSDLQRRLVRPLQFSLSDDPAQLRNPSRASVRRSTARPGALPRSSVQTLRISATWVPSRQLGCNRGRDAAALLVARQAGHRPRERARGHHRADHSAAAFDRSSVVPDLSNSIEHADDDLFAALPAQLCANRKSRLASRGGRRRLCSVSERTKSLRRSLPPFPLHCSLSSGGGDFASPSFGGVPLPCLEWSPSSAHWCLPSSRERSRSAAPAWSLSQGADFSSCGPITTGGPIMRSTSSPRRACISGRPPLGWFRGAEALVQGRTHAGLTALSHWQSRFGLLESPVSGTSIAGSVE